MSKGVNFGETNIIKIIPIPSTGNFFKAWLEVIKPIHHLTDREMDLLAEFLKRRHGLQRTILEEGMVDDNLMSTKSKKSIREACNISDVYYQKMYVKFRERNIIIDDPNIKCGKINPLVIPSLKDEDKSVGVLFIFNNPNDG